MRKKLPYFDFLFAAFDEGFDALEKSFGNHVHWGFWESPKQAVLTPEDFADAAENLTKLICSTAQVTESQKVLDVGCGFGGTVASLNSRLQMMDLTGLNIDERQLARARQHVIPIGSNKIEFIQGDACELPFEDNTFDVILAVECIFHFPSREQFFNEAYRVLKPGGYLALSDFLLSRKFSKFHNLKVSQYLTNGFFGSCNVEYTRGKYLNLAQETHFDVVFEKNITQNTLPTYTYFLSLIKDPKIDLLTSIGIIFTIFCIQQLSRLNALQYFVFSFRKPLG